jgi:hypothetical protein
MSGPARFLPDRQRALPTSLVPDERAAKVCKSQYDPVEQIRACDAAHRDHLSGFGQHAARIDPIFTLPARFTQELLATRKRLVFRLVPPVEPQARRPGTQSKITCPVRRAPVDGDISEMLSFGAQMCCFHDLRRVHEATIPGFRE